MMEMISLRQAARKLGVADRVLRQAVRSGELPAFEEVGRLTAAARAEGAEAEPQAPR